MFDGNMLARTILIFSGALIVVLCVGAIEYIREEKDTKKADQQ